MIKYLIIDKIVKDFFLQLECQLGYELTGKLSLYVKYVIYVINQTNHESNLINNITYK